MAASGMARGSRRSRVWVREILSPAEARAGYPRLWEVAQVLVPGLTDDALGRVVSLVVDTCPACYRGDRGCRCREAGAGPPGPPPAGGGRPASD